MARRLTGTRKGRVEAICRTREEWGRSLCRQGQSGESRETSVRDGKVLRRALEVLGDRMGEGEQGLILGV